MEHRQNTRAQQTRERLRAAAHRLFLQQGYQATSIDAILAEAGISSKETFYRHYASKEALFVDVLSHLTMEQPGFSEKLSALPAPHDLAALQEALTQLSREILSMMCQPGYLPLIRMIIAEAHRRSTAFPAARHPVFLDCHAARSRHHHRTITNSQRATDHCRH